jgi:hypothetical protein
LKCARHPDVETNLQCGKCGTPICPKCLVQTPVGARCPDCAAVRQLPIYEVPALLYVRGLAAGLITGGALGAAWYYIPIAGLLWLLIAVGIGYATGEMVSLSVNRKRGRGLQVVGALGVLASYSVRGMLEARDFGYVSSFLDVYALIALFLGVVVAVSILRPH